jgi:hypothetical protein
MGPHPTSILDNWHIWSTPTFGRDATWSAKPDGAMSAVVFGGDLMALEKNIAKYMGDLDAHVREARRKLDSLPANYTGERQVQEALISALAALAQTTRA